MILVFANFIRKSKRCVFTTTTTKTQFIPRREIIQGEH